MRANKPMTTLLDHHDPRPYQAHYPNRQSLSPSATDHPNPDNRVPDMPNPSRLNVHHCKYNCTSEIHPYDGNCQPPSPPIFHRVSCVLNWKCKKNVRRNPTLPGEFIIEKTCADFSTPRNWQSYSEMKGELKKPAHVTLTCVAQS